MVYKGKYASENYNSFIGAPLLVGDISIGVIKAQKGEENQYEDFFTTEDAQILQMLAFISAITIKSHRNFELIRRHDQKIINLYRIGSSCSELKDMDEIMWYLMTGITHNDGIGLNRIIIFEVNKEQDEYELIGKMAIGPKNCKAGKALQIEIEKKGIDLDICLGNYRNSNRTIPSNPLQNLLNNYRVHVIKNSPIYNLLSKSNSEAEQLIMNNCEPELIGIFDEIECVNPVMFNLCIGAEKCIIGFCDYVYTPEAEQEDIKNAIIPLANILLKQIAHVSIL